MDVGWDGSSKAAQLNFRVPAVLTDRLNQSRPCCGSWADLPYQAIHEQGTIEVDIGSDAPTFEFATGKSHFAAYRLPDWPRPLTLHVDSFRTAEPGGLGKLIPELRGLIFRPVVLILDEKYRVTRTIDAFLPGASCQRNAFLPALSAQFEVETEPANSAYMVVLTSDAYRKEAGMSVCGGTVHGFSPVGHLEITLGSLGFGDGRILYKAPFVWHKNAHGGDDVGLFTGMFKDPATLLVTGDGLHLVKWTGKGYAELFSAANERIVSVNVDAIPGSGDGGLLVLGVAGAAPGDIEYHTLSAGRTASPARVESLLRPRLRPAWQGEKVGVSVSRTQPLVDIIQARSPSASAQRIGDSALAGGMVVAMPCGLCQTGACPPEVLAPCAALFAVGAAVGGVIGIGKEMVSAGPAEKPQPRLSEADVAATLPTMRNTTVTRIAGMQFEQCLARQLQGANGSLDQGGQWLSQGRRGVVTGLGTDAPVSAEGSRFTALQRDGYRFVAESHIETVRLLAEGVSGQALTDMPVRIEVAGHVRFYDLNRHVSRDLPLRWRSEALRWSSWSTGMPSLLEATLAQACEELAKQAMDTTKATWMRW